MKIYKYQFLLNELKIIKIVKHF